MFISTFTGLRLNLVVAAFHIPLIPYLDHDMMISFYFIFLLPGFLQSETSIFAPTISLSQFFPSYEFLAHLLCLFVTFMQQALNAQSRALLMQKLDRSGITARFV